MLFLSDLVDYFRGLCEAHPDLLHDEASGSRVFEVVPLEEAFNDIRSGAKEKGYLVRLVLPTMSMSDHQNNAAKVYEVGLMVLKYHGTREAMKANYIAALTDAEKVADNFIASMVQDSRDGNALFFGRSDRVEWMQVSGDFVTLDGDGSYSGVQYTFRMATFRCFDE